MHMASPFHNRLTRCSCLQRRPAKHMPLFDIEIIPQPPGWRPDGTLGGHQQQLDGTFPHPPWWASATAPYPPPPNLSEAAETPNHHAQVQPHLPPGAGRSRSKNDSVATTRVKPPKQGRKRPREEELGKKKETKK